jgi:predicted small lipoprotein YifL
MCSHVLFVTPFRAGTSSTTFIKGKKMKQSLLVAALLALAVTACGKKEAPAAAAAQAAPAAAPAAPAPAAK